MKSGAIHSVAYDKFEWPLFALKDDVRPLLLKCRQSGQRAALVTLVGRSGPAPRPLGSQMLIAEDGNIAGYVSGGCVESNLALIAKRAMETGQSVLLAFGDDSPYLDVRLPCGTRIEVALDILEPGDPAVTALLELSEARQPSLWVSDIATGERVCISLDQTQAAITHFRLAADLPRVGADQKTYWLHQAPTFRLVVNGDDAVALALVEHGRLMGFETILNRTHGPESRPLGLGDRYLRLNGSKLADVLIFDRWTAVITTRHDVEADHDVLAKALPSDAFYVGALGSRRHRPAREKLLRDAGVSDDQIARLNSPVGLDIGAATASEIALSIMADIVQRNRTQNSFR